MSSRSVSSSARPRGGVCRRPSGQEQRIGVERSGSTSSVMHCPAAGRYLRRRARSPCSGAERDPVEPDAGHRACRRRIEFAASDRRGGLASSSMIFSMKGSKRSRSSSEQSHSVGPIPRHREDPDVRPSRVDVLASAHACTTPNAGPPDARRCSNSGPLLLPHPTYEMRTQGERFPADRRTGPRGPGRPSGVGIRAASSLFRRPSEPSSAAMPSICSRRDAPRISRGAPGPAPVEAPDELPVHQDPIALAIPSGADASTVACQAATGRGRSALARLSGTESRSSVRSCTASASVQLVEEGDTPVPQRSAGASPGVADGVSQGAIRGDRSPWVGRS